MNSLATALDLTLLEEGFCADDFVQQKIRESSLLDKEDAFYVADLGDVLQMHLRWMRAMPRVAPFYAVKCNDSREVVMTLAALGTGFDCASQNEIQQVLSLGVDPSRIIYAHPCKQKSHIRYASVHGVQMMTFDSEEELVKVAHCHENSKMVLRIVTDDTKALFPLSVKFGATLKTSHFLLQRARELGLDVIGVSFHAGSCCTDPETYSRAILDAYSIFDMGAKLGYNMTLLDIGGGFPGLNDSNRKFEEFTAVINSALDTYFPADSGVQVIAEPGRYYVSSAYTLAVNIIAKKVVTEDVEACDEKDDGAKERTMMYYVNDGIYCSFIRVHYNLPVLASPLKKPKPDEHKYVCSIWGQTCCGYDCIEKRCTLPDLEVGEWLLFKNMGAYSMSISTTFNGFRKPNIHYVMSQSAWKQIQQISAHGQIFAGLTLSYLGKESSLESLDKPCPANVQ